MVTQTLLTVRYAETDRMGIAHHSHYPVWFEQARTEFVTRCGLTYSQMEQEGVLTPLSELHCRFLSHAGYEDRLLVETRMTRLTPARVQFEYRVLREGEQTPLCLGYTLHGFVSRELRPYNFKKARPDLFAKFQACLEESLF